MLLLWKAYTQSILVSAESLLDIASLEFLRSLLLALATFARSALWWETLICNERLFSISGPYPLKAISVLL